MATREGWYKMVESQMKMRNKTTSHGATDRVRHGWDYPQMLGDEYYDQTERSIYTLDQRLLNAGLPTVKYFK